MYISRVHLYLSTRMTGDWPYLPMALGPGWSVNESCQRNLRTELLNAEVFWRINMKVKYDMKCCLFNTKVQVLRKFEHICKVCPLLFACMKQIGRLCCFIHRGSYRSVHFILYLLNKLITTIFCEPWKEHDKS